MNKLLLCISLLLVISLPSCSSDSKQQFEFAGGTLKLCLDIDPGTFVPRDIKDTYSATVVSQVAECLVSFNPEDLSVQPQLAEKWSISPDGRVFSFTIRKDVLFHPHKMFTSDDDRQLTLDDVLYSFEESCRPDKNGDATNAYISLFGNQVVGAREFFEGKAKSIKGFKVKGNVFELTLEKPDPNYINKLAQVNAAIVSKKIGKTNATDCVGTGPFVLAEVIDGEEKQIVLTKNEDYYLTDKKGNSLPYLDSVVFIVEPRKLEQLEKFESGETQFLSSLPTSRITEMLEGRIKDFNSEPPLMVLHNNPLLITNYYFFNMNEERFKDPRVRQAFNYAIDRERITRDVLHGQYHENGIYGMVPPIGTAFKGYDFSGVKKAGYSYNPELAKKLLAEAGFPNGKGFGSVNLRINIGDVNSAVAEEISSQIYQNLGINVNIDGSSFELKDEDADYARGDMFRTAWIADFSSPETFLGNFYGGYLPANPGAPSQMNQARYRNVVFDKYFEQAREANSQRESYRLFAEAEKELLKDPPIIVLWYANEFQLSYSKVRNLKVNAMNFLDLKEVYMKDWTKEEFLKSIQ